MSEKSDEGPAMQQIYTQGIRYGKNLYIVVIPFRVLKPLYINASNQSDAYLCNCSPLEGIIAKLNLAHTKLQAST